MEKITFTLSETQEEVEFFVLEETKINGYQYLLVTESEEEGAKAHILKDLAKMNEEEAVYEMVDSNEELRIVSQIFAEIIDIDFEMESDD